MRSRFIAFLGLAAAGAVNIVLGTLCSRNAWVAAAAMAVVGFAILSSGAINGSFRRRRNPALLTFILPFTLTGLRRGYLAAPHRPSGPIGPTDALASPSSTSSTGSGRQSSRPSGSVRSRISARQVAGHALLASGKPAPELDELDVAGGDVASRPARAAVEATERLAVEHAAGGSVWLRNSLRGAAGLAVAVFIAQRTGLQPSRRDR
jgi:hypothetical protein